MEQLAVHQTERMYQLSSSAFVLVVMVDIIDETAMSPSLQFTPNYAFLYFHRPINIILSAEWSNYIKTYLTDFLNQSQNFTIVSRLPWSRAEIGLRSADTSADDKWLIQI